MTNEAFFRLHWNPSSPLSVNGQAMQLYSLAVAMRVRSAYSARGFGSAAAYWHKKLKSAEGKDGQ